MAEASAKEPMLLAYHPVANVNPYQSLIYGRFAECGVGVLPLYDRADASSLACLQGFDIPVVLHLHWTAWVLSGAVDERDARARVDQAIAWLEGLKQSGIRLMWSIHNILPHDIVFVRQQTRLQQWLVDHADVLHVLNQNTPQAVQHIMTIPPHKMIYAPHPNYIGAYASSITREQARMALGIDVDEIVYVMVGAIKAYKGIGHLIDAVERLGTTPPRRLLVAGKSDGGASAADFVRECRRHPRILIDDRRIAENEMQIYLRAADIAVLPYQRALNSGAAMLSLSFGIPVVAPAVGALVEVLSDDCGELFEPGDVEGFINALRKADRLITKEARIAAVAAAKKYDPAEISRAFALELRRRFVENPGRES